LAQQTQILVIDSENLLAASILSLLDSCFEFDVTHSTITSLTSTAGPTGHQIDVVIIEEEHLMTNMSAFVSFTDHHPNLRLIVLRQSENKVHIFDKHMVEVRQVSDFLELLRSSKSYRLISVPIEEMPGD